MERNAKTLDKIYRYITRANDARVLEVLIWANCAWPIAYLAHYGDISVSGVTDVGWISVEHLDKYLHEHFDNYCDFA